MVIFKKCLQIWFLLIIPFFAMSLAVGCLKNPQNAKAAQGEAGNNSEGNNRQVELADAKSLIRAGNEAASKYQTDEASKDFEQAIKILNGLIKADDGDCELFLNRGFAWMGKGDPVLAGEDFTSCIKFCPDHDICYLNRGRAYKFQNDLDAAQNEFDIIIAKGKYADQDVLSDAYFEHGLINVIQEYYWDAVTDFNKAANLVPDDRARQKEIIYYRAVANYHISFLWNPPNQAYKKEAVEDMAESCQLGNRNACQWNWNNNIITQKIEREKKNLKTHHND